MVYEKECAECGTIIDFGSGDEERLPRNVIKFNGEIYCRECVEMFVNFGIGDVQERVDEVESKIDTIMKELGLKDL